MKQLCAKNGHLENEIEDTEQYRHLKIIINRLDGVELIGLSRIGTDDTFHGSVIADIITSAATAVLKMDGLRLRDIIGSRLIIMRK